jgi:hypothetical protein
MYRYYSGIGRYIPLEQKNVSNILMLDTTTGAVYSVGKKGVIPFFPSEKKPESPISQ